MLDLSINQVKTKCCIFSNDRKKNENDFINLCGSGITLVDDYKYL